jgi:hypothetical protein
LSALVPHQPFTGGNQGIEVIEPTVQDNATVCIGALGLGTQFGVVRVQSHIGVTCAVDAVHCGKKFRATRQGDSHGMWD